MPFAANYFVANESTWRWSGPAIPASEEAAETIWRTVNAVSTCCNTFNFFDYLVIFRYYFTGDGKVSCILTTAVPYPIDFLIQRFKNKSCLVVFFSYWTKCESPAGDQFWKFSRQCSIFGSTGDQWVAISSPVITCFLKYWSCAHSILPLQAIFFFISQLKEDDLYARIMLQNCWSPCFVKLSLKEISWNVCAPTSCTYLLILIGPMRTLKALTSCVHVLMMQEWCAFRMCNAIVRNHLKSNFSPMMSSIPPKPDITSWVLS